MAAETESQSTAAAICPGCGGVRDHEALRFCAGCRQADLVPLAAILYAVAGDGRVCCESCGAPMCIRPDCLPTLSLVDRAEWEAWDADDPGSRRPRTLRLLTVRAVEA